jgi:mono/diheme cytochrome c family protein
MASRAVFQRLSVGRIGIGASAALVLAVAAFWLIGDRKKAERDHAGWMVLGKQVYATHCAACHGASLEGQPNWRQRLATGRLPAPPHDATGHTWHHPDRVLFDITKHGVAVHAPAGYESDMPAFKDKLGDAEIWAVLDFIKSTWPTEIRARQADISARAP